METKQNCLLLVGALAAILVAVAGKAVTKTDDVIQKVSSPDFCNDLDCPRYKVLDATHPNWEERLYEESRWVGTTSTGVDFKDAGSKMFMKLFRYIEGANVEGVSIPMAAPVIVKATMDDEESDDAFLTNLTMSFYLPYTYQNTSNPVPTPKDRDVFLWTLPTSKVFVRSFDGYATESKDILQARSLAEELGKEREYDHGYLYTAGYNSPWQLFNRHNEIWFASRD